MKLLASQEINTVEKTRTTTRILEGMKLSKAVQRERKLLNDLHEERRLFESKQKEHLIRVENDCSSKRESLTREIENLRARRIELMKPIDDIMVRAKERENELISEQEVLEEKKTKLEQLLAKVRNDEKDLQKTRIETNEILSKAQKETKRVLLQGSELEGSKVVFNKAVKDAEDLIKAKMSVVKAREEKASIQETKNKKKEQFLNGKEQAQRDLENKLQAWELRLSKHHKRLYGTS